MKRRTWIVIFLFAANALLLSQGDDLLNNSRAASTNVPNAEFPRITPDLRVTYRIKAPDAQKVQFDLMKKYDMVKDIAGFWTVTTDPQVPGFHYYQLWIDGVSVADPASETFYGVGRMFSAIEIPNADEDFYKIKDVPHGDIRTKWYFSGTTGEWRKIYIYCPPSYETSLTKKYPVLYIQHGGGEDQRGWAVQGMTDIIIDNLISEGKAKEMLVVMETSSARKPGETPVQMRPPVPPKPGQRPRFNFSFDTYKEVMINDLIPFIDKNFRTLTDSRNRAMAGLSMGGMVTTSVTLSNLDKFAYLGCFSGGPRITPQDTLSKIYNGAFADPVTFNKKVKLLFISNGTVEGNSPIEAGEILKKAGIENVVVYQSPGTAHEWLTWRRSLHQFAELIFK